MCLVVLLGAVLPRLTLALLWFFTEWTRVLSPWWLGFLGFLVLPYTTLAYVCIHRWSGGVSVNSMGHVVIVLVALLMDAGSWGGSHKHYRARS
jgi:formate hydrogenlyase subunit 3/multisubunit Na+/H+ antiporter MnhD subunit